MLNESRASKICYLRLHKNLIWNKILLCGTWKIRQTKTAELPAAPSGQRNNHFFFLFFVVSLFLFVFLQLLVWAASCSVSESFLCGGLIFWELWICSLLRRRAQQRLFWAFLMWTVTGGWTDDQQPESSGRTEGFVSTGPGATARRLKGFYSFLFLFGCLFVPHLRVWQVNKTNYVSYVL